MSDVLTIQQASEQCGVNPVTLRAWERRYGLLKPERTAKGHRRYRSAEVDQIRRIVHWVEKGVPISQVASLLSGEQEPLLSADNGVPWAQASQDALLALETMNGRRLEQLLNSLLADYSHAQVIRELSDPLREQLAGSPSLSAHLALLEAVLTQKWAARSLSLSPKRREFGWLLVPVGDVLPALELAMVLQRPLWCLQRDVDVDALSALLADRQPCGVLWVIDRWPTAGQRQRLWPQQNQPWPVACWGRLLEAPPASVTRLTGDRQAVAEQLLALEGDRDVL
ncbi:MerR family transcriptional regulator [Alcanivorax jadensis T9]|uniref:MerR family transcriptional regulator n=1 Tax=Alcanivorax jadensis T9 TaxID=1177181 RepID=A0ABR4WB62_9GAMM|nr:MerR family transcriptional regulator [Alcanivorax jadensis]KGD60465.1 MerR family transcriptional regulator [Alcanivorax jadensis T9]